MYRRTIRSRAVEITIYRTIFLILFDIYFSIPPYSTIRRHEPYRIVSTREYNDVFLFAPPPLRIIFTFEFVFECNKYVCVCLCVCVKGKHKTTFGSFSAINRRMGIKIKKNSGIRTKSKLLLFVHVPGVRCTERTTKI